VQLQIRKTVVSCLKVSLSWCHRCGDVDSAKLHHPTEDTNQILELIGTLVIQLLRNVKFGLVPATLRLPWSSKEGLADQDSILHVRITRHVTARLLHIIVKVIMADISTKILGGSVILLPVVGSSFRQYRPYRVSMTSFGHSETVRILST
jgi:hypothetical protein